MGDKDRLPDCLLLPDLTTTQVQRALREVYLGNGLDNLLELVITRKSEAVKELLLLVT